MKPTMTHRLLAATLVAVPALGSAQEVPSARTLAGNCASCHGTAGLARGAMPSLAGMAPDFFVEQMRRFRDGKRPATVMHQIAKGYRDEEIARLAEFFARQTRPGGSR
jgi:cytochrome c553